MFWNYIDVLLFLFILLHVWYGWQRGFLLGLLDLLQWIAGFLVALRFYKPAAKFLNLFVNVSDAWLLPLSFLFVALLTSALIRWLGYLLLRRLPKEVHKKSVNQVLGMLPGFASGLINAAIVASLLLTLPLSDGLHRAASESVLTNRFSESTAKIEAALSPIFDEAIARTITFLTVRPEPEANERVELPYTVANTRPRPELETEMLRLVNQERAVAGLKPLEADPELTEVAREHSVDMFARGYFAHVTPEGKSPFNRMQEAGVRFLAAGENLALAPTLSIAHTGLMNSPGHRANILRPQFGRVGIGVMDGGRRGLMITQDFRN